MIAEPYICIKGPRAGEILWVELVDSEAAPDGTQIVYSDDCGFDARDWQPYADFEREKLKALDATFYINTANGLYFHVGRVGRKAIFYYASDEIDYFYAQYKIDSESGRLLKRAEFLKAVCEKEGVEWLPKAEGKCTCRYPCKMGCLCNCHEYIKRPDGTHVRSDMICGCYGEGKPKFVDGRRCCRNCGYPETEPYAKPMVVIGNEFEEDHCEQCCNGSCSCPCHGEKRKEHPSRTTQRMRMQGLPRSETECICGPTVLYGCPRHFPERPNPERDYYTKAEVDALLKNVVRFDPNVRVSAGPGFDLCRDNGGAAGPGTSGGQGYGGKPIPG